MAPQVDLDDEPKRRKAVATHDYLDASGNVVDSEEEARGYRYTLKGNGKSAEWSYDKATDDERRMLSIFGVKTLCTNETSMLRNNDKLSDADKDDNAQIAAVEARLGFIRDGYWSDPDAVREGFVAVDRPKLASALVNMQIAAGKFGEDQRDAKVADALRRFEEEQGYMAKVRKVPQVAEEYAKLQGKTAVTLDDL